MSTIEKLFVQIFERKNSIIEQVKHQVDLYDQHLASKLLIDGIAPPPWLWNPGSLTQTSDPSELKKEELISELLLPRPQPAIPCFSGQCSLYHKKLVSVKNAEVSDGVFTETHASEKGFDAGDGQTRLSQSHVNDVGCGLNGVPELDSTATSPKPQVHASALDRYPKPEQSLARFQRSKSRQRALEIRSSARTGARSRFIDENIPGRIAISGGSCQLPSHVSDSPMDSSSCIAEKDGHNFVESTGKFVQQPNYANELIEMVNPSDITNGIYGKSEVKITDCQSKKEGNDNYCGRITRSRSSCLKFNHVTESSKLESSFDVPDVDGGILEQSIGKLMQPSQPPSLIGGDTDFQKALGNQIPVETSLPSQKDLELPAKNTREHQSKGNGADEYVGRPAEAGFLCSGSKLDGASLRVGMEVLVSRPPSDSAMFVKPKQLNFDNVGEHSLNETFGPSVEENRGDRSLEMVPLTCLEPVESLSRETSINHQEKRDSSLEKPLLEDQEILSKEEEAQRVSSEAHVKERVEVETKNIGCDVCLASSASGISNLEAVSSIKQTSDVCKDAVTQTWVEQSSLDSKLSNVDADTRMNCSFEKGISSGMEGSWPQYKRRKIEGQLANVLSAPPCLRIRPLQSNLGDTIDRYLSSVKDNSEVTSHEEDVAKIPDLEIHQDVNSHLLEGYGNSSKLQVEEGELSLEGRAKIATTPFTFKQEMEGPYSVSSLTKQATGGSQGLLEEEAGGVDPTTMILDVRRECTVEDNQNSLHLEDKLDQEKPENMICTESNMLDMKSHVEQDDLFSYCSVGSLHNQYLDMIGTDQAMPVFEGFIVQTDDEQPRIAGGGINFHGMDLPNSTTERASALEHFHKSANMHTPFPPFSTTYKLQKTPDLYQSVPNGLLERIDMKNALLDNDDGGKQYEASHSYMNDEVNCAFQVRSYSDGLLYSSPRFGWNVRKLYASPGRTMSNSGCSEKQGSLNPELTCFPIEEDPSISEEIGNTDEVGSTFQEAIGSTALKNSGKSEPLADITEDYRNRPASVSAAEKFHDRGSLDSVNMEVNFTGTHNEVKQKLGNHYSSKRRCTNEAKENQSLSIGGNAVKKATEALHNRFSKPKLSRKSSSRKGGPSFSQRESKHNNIVSNIASFIPLVQKKQAAAIITGKRDIKVRALEAAETAKRLEEKKENERKMKKEALKLERARLEQENLRQLELKKKKKEDEQKKKNVEMAARKRLREEEERKEKEGKRRRIDEARRQKREQEEKLHAEKQEKETRCQVMDERVHERKELKDEIGKYKSKEKEKGNENLGKKPEAEPRTPGVHTSDVSKATVVLKNCEPSRNCSHIGEVMCSLDKAIENDDLVTKTSREQSYEISPYQGSDDEEEEEDMIPNKKFVPSWASKSSLALVVFSQQKVDPDVIFPPESFCSIAEVLLPRKQQLK
ncbi:hypothetical protein L1049_000810 [Liquidambar formosana]|uniref:Inner centromere protein ARK-binding domain-containing protein n=1 Tax=Liquidambar formosana TaxID=63359 RepID=A0AAP0N9G2_LIQFO